MKTHIIDRLLKVPDHSFFLFGARGTGKSTWLRRSLPDAVYLDLLDSSLQLELTAAPHRLESIVGDPGPGQWVVLDEVQKIPALLGEVHRLMEKRDLKFALCGSSARKLRRGGADLLAGRAITISMEPFCSAELGDRFDLDEALNWGLLPVVHGRTSLAPDILGAYVDTYLREEIKEEGAVRKFAPFVRFLTVAGLLNGQVLNTENIAREARVPRTTVDGYFELLGDTLLGFTLPAYRPGLKVREAARPKFYWLDSGIARACAGLLRDPPASDWRGAALETLLFHEIRVRNAVSGSHRPIAYYRTASGVEIDFIVETRKRQQGARPRVVCIEVKHSETWQRKWERPMLDMAADDRIETDRMVGVYRGDKIYRFGEIDVLPVEEFLSRLHRGQVF
jgi:predicted AAA+ superfamily ATPase